MKNAAELQLRRLALVVTALLVLQLVWSGLRLWLVSDPEPIAPAESSLQVAGLIFGAGTEDVDALDLASRPLFWQGRQPYTAQVKSAAPVSRARNSDGKAIKDVKLLGVYAAGPDSGIIVAHEGTRKRVRLNESIGGWEFTMMSADGAIFEKGDDSRVLQLEHANVSGGAPQPGVIRPSSRSARLDAARRLREERRAAARNNATSDEDPDREGD